MNNEKKTVTSADFVWKNFQRMFPEKAEHVLSYEKSGSKMINLEMDDGMILTFLYYTPMNWNFGTKPWRMKPRQAEKEEDYIPEYPADYSE